MMIRMPMHELTYQASYFASSLYQRCSRKFKRLTRPARKATISHLDEADESYLQHLWFTITMAARFFWVGIVLIIHGLIPFVFTRTASNETARINAIMQSRRTLVNDRAAQKNDQRNYDI